MKPVTVSPATATNTKFFKQSRLDKEGASVTVWTMLENQPVRSLLGVATLGEEGGAARLWELIGHRAFVTS